MAFFQIYIVRSWANITLLVFIKSLTWSKNSAFRILIDLKIYRYDLGLVSQVLPRTWVLSIFLFSNHFNQLQRWDKWLIICLNHLESSLIRYFYPFLPKYFCLFLSNVTRVTHLLIKYLLFFVFIWISLTIFIWFYSLVTTKSKSGLLFFK